jgi:tRNA (cmo5U34)-methyltransferase
MPDNIRLRLPYRSFMTDNVTPNRRDTLFAELVAEPSTFSFNDAVVDVFPDMIQRSVPGYGTVVKMSGILSEQYAQEGTHIYDLGCSLGESIRSVEGALNGRDCHLVGVDNSPAMIAKAQQIDSGIKWRLADVTTLPLERSSVVIMNFTLQFIPIEQRLSLLTKIREAMVPGGLLILSEKLMLPDPDMDALMIDLHHDFKRSQGYTDLEIAQKRDAIENVLIPETAETHTQRLQEAGFSRSSIWFQCLNFASFIAIA